ncbi:MAG TPA: sigma 54-interacting transcriptional regulator [Terriglobia bacterium]|nr:sigma 54-interacting transcriptional regulator [Terriglobia bacterium]
MAVTSRNGFLPPEESILGASSAMNEVREKLEKIAYTDVAVLIRGEVGSGKEVLARLIHKKYPGEETPFHKVTPAGRAGWRQSASFMTPCEEVKSAGENGHEARGSTASPGCIGTLFFDEVAELNSASQRTLAQLLYDDKLPGVDTSDYAPPLFRIICSTRHDLDRAVSLRSFREDLFYSINIVSLCLPPLRARREDIPGLAMYFWETYREELGSIAPAPSDSLIDALEAYDWPGNIREFASVMRSYVLWGSVGEIIDELAARGAPAPAPAHNNSAARGVSLKRLAKQRVREVERKIIFKTLSETQWNRRRAARALNISYRTLLYKIKEAGVPPKRITVKRER